MRSPDGRSLWDLTVASGLSPRRFVADSAGRFAVADFAAAGNLATGNLAAGAEALRGRTVLISCERQVPAVQALLQLDGIARRILLCPPDLAPDHVPAVIHEAEVDAVVSDGTGPASQSFAGQSFAGQSVAGQSVAGQSVAGQSVAGTPLIAIGRDLTPAAPNPDRSRQTEWLLFTSGTTGRPKIVVHTLASLTGPLNDGLAAASDAVWSTFYDIRRYGGLQILLRALLGGGSMVLSQAHEGVADFLARAQQSGVTHISGTPSHWRRALMSPAVRQFTPNYVRLSGEVADQAVLNNLAAAFPRAEIAHAFASTEAGVAFDVRDGLAGFPASLIGQPGAKAEMRVIDGSLRIRSARTASRYLGDGNRLVDDDGFVDTGDMLELRGDRYHFVGRREGIVNVGGQKVHPEEVEAVINQHPAVQMARVRGRRSAITGAIVVADVVLRPGAGSLQAVKDDILEACRRALPPHKVPAMLTEVAGLAVAESGKLMRQGA
jgi:acyl-CoA synthetase (AMP-forming)/AMP-acid ligase II